MLANPFERLAELDSGEKGCISLHSPFRDDSNVCVTKTGLFALGVKSRKVEEIEFCSWILSDVIPAMKKKVTSLKPTAIRVLTPVSTHDTGKKVFMLNSL